MVDFCSNGSFCVFSADPRFTGNWPQKSAKDAKKYSLKAVWLDAFSCAFCAFLRPMGRSLGLFYAFLWQSVFSWLRRKANCTDRRNFLFCGCSQPSYPMNPIWRGFPLALGLFIARQPSPAQTASVAAFPGNDDPSIPPPNVKKEMNDLVRADAQAVAAAEKPNTDGKVKKSTHVVLLDPYIVRSSKTVIIPPYETGIDRLLKSGDLPLQIGKKMAVELSVIRPSSLGRGGNPNGISGAGKAQIAIHFSW